MDNYFFSLSLYTSSCSSWTTPFSVADILWLAWSRCLVIGTHNIRHPLSSAPRAYCGCLISDRVRGSLSWATIPSRGLFSDLRRPNMALMVRRYLITVVGCGWWRAFVTHTHRTFFAVHTAYCHRWLDGHWREYIRSITTYTVGFNWTRFDPENRALLVTFLFFFLVWWFMEGTLRRKTLFARTISPQ